MLLRRSTQTCTSSLLLWLFACGVGQWAACEASPVRNVRVHVYRPHRNSALVSALIVWDSSVSNSSQVQYAVNAYTAEGLPLTTLNAWKDAGATYNIWEGPPFPVNGDSKHFSLTFHLPDLGNYLFYPMFEDNIYSVTVSYTTELGETGESESVSFDTHGPSPPLEVLATGLGQSFLVGKNTTAAIQHVGQPVTVNTVDRELFHYNSDTHSLHRTTIDTDASKVVTNLPSDLIPSALSYDWLGMAIYLAGMNSTNGMFGIWKYVLASKSLHHLFSQALDDEVEVTMVMNPFTGHLYWTENAAINDAATLYQLNLRDNTMVTLAYPSGDLQLSSALALDSITDRLWVSDQSNGNILSCDVSTGTLNCQTEVNTSPLLNSNRTIESITVDELRVYWTSQDNLSVYYVPREDPSSLMTLNSNPHGHHLHGLSPGQQPWLAAAECFPGFPCANLTNACLTPALGSVTSDPNRPAVQLVNKTNSSISVNWTIPQMLPHCQESVFSFPPLQYTLQVTEDMDDLPGFPKKLFENQFTVTDLEPFSEYVFEVEARNSFTATDTKYKFGSEKELMTAEGVPLGGVENIQSFPYGPRNMFIVWDRLSEEILKGDEDSQLFFASLDPVMSVHTGTAQIDITEGLEPATNYTFNVLVNNGVFNSTLSSIQTDSTWSLPPSPQLTSLTNGSAISVTTESVMADVHLSQRHKDIYQLYLEMYPEESPNETVTSAAVNCGNLPGVSNVISFELNLTNVSSVGVFHLRTVAKYRSIKIPKLKNAVLGPVTEFSDAIQLTRADVPDAPRLDILSDQLTVNWTVPYDNGSPVKGFFLLARNQAGVVASVEKELLRTPNQTAKPSQELSLEPGEEYQITVVAYNAIGNGSESNPVPLRAPETDDDLLTDLFPLLYIPIAVVLAAAAIILLLVVAFFIGYRYRRNRAFKNISGPSGKSPSRNTSNVQTHFMGPSGSDKIPAPLWEEKESLSEVYSSKPRTSSHPISMPSAYRPELPDESLTPNSPSECTPPRYTLAKKRPPARLHLNSSMGSIYANSDTSTPVESSPLPGAYKFDSGRVYENRNLSTPDSPLTVSSNPLGPGHGTEKSSSSCNPSSDKSEC